MTATASSVRCKLTQKTLQYIDFQRNFWRERGIRTASQLLDHTDISGCRDFRYHQKYPQCSLAGTRGLQSSDRQLPTNGLQITDQGFYALALRHSKCYWFGSLPHMNCYRGLHAHRVPPITLGQVRGYQDDAHRTGRPSRLRRRSDIALCTLQGARDTTGERHPVTPLMTQPVTKLREAIRGSMGL